MKVNRLVYWPIKPRYSNVASRSLMAMRAHCRRWSNTGHQAIGQTRWQQVTHAISRSHKHSPVTSYPPEGVQPCELEKMWQPLATQKGWTRRFPGASLRKKGRSPGEPTYRQMRLCLQVHREAVYLITQAISWESPHLPWLQAQI